MISFGSDDDHRDGELGCRISLAPVEDGVNELVHTRKAGAHVAHDKKTHALTILSNRMRRKRGREAWIGFWLGLAASLFIPDQWFQQG